MSEKQQQHHNTHLIDHHLTVVLFAKSRGSDATSYRPNRHETQWWNRRDALVRCVVSFLFGPSPPPLTSSLNNSNNKTLVILFDEDWSRMQMTYTSSSSSSSSSSCFIPTEQNVVTLWKQAAMAPGTVVSHGGGLSCQLILPPQLSSPSSSLPPLSGMDSKRDILEFLQKTCSIDFLRIHGLNSTMNVILRKHNKKSILEIWHKWNSTQYFVQQHQQQQQELEGNNKNTKENKNVPILKAILQEILWQQQQQQPTHHSQNISSSSSSSSSSVSTQQQPLLVVAGTLHESHHAELPCWDTEDHSSTSSLSLSSSSFLEQQLHQKYQQHTIMHVFLFLGAVRDMYPYEYDCLYQVVQQQQQQVQLEASSSSATGAMIRTTVPVIRIRLGPVAEFTSKILTVLAFHHSTGRLGMAIQKLVYQQHNADAATTPAEASPTHPNDNNSNHDSNNNHDCNGSNDTLVTAKAGMKRPRTPAAADSFKNTNNDTMATTTHPTESAATTSRRGRGSCLQLEVVCLLPTLESCNVTTDLNQRSLALWCLVRCTVTALWRSRLASSSSGATSSTMSTTTAESPSLTTTTLTLIFCDGTILRLRQDEIVKAMAEQHQAAPCEYQILASIEKQLKEQQQQESHTSQKVNRKATTTTSTEFWKARASHILATIIQNDDNDNDDGKTSYGSFHVLDLTASTARSTAGDASISTMPNIHKRRDPQHVDADADDEETTCLDLTKHIYSVNAARTNSNLKNSGMDVKSITTIALISIDDNDKFHSTSASNTMNKSHQQHQQQHDNNTMMAMRMRNGFVQACRHAGRTVAQSSCKIPVYTCPTFLTTDISISTSTTTISSSISLPPAASAATATTATTTHSNRCYHDDACIDKQAAMITLLQHFLYQNRRLVPDKSQATAGPTSNPVRDNDSVNNGDNKRINLITKADDATDDKSSLPSAKKLKKKKDKKKKKKKHNGEK